MCLYSCHPAWAPRTGGEGLGSGTFLCLDILCTCAPSMLVPKVHGKVSVQQVLGRHREERQGPISLGTAKEEGTTVPWVSTVLDMEWH